MKNLSWMIILYNMVISLNYQHLYDFIKEWDVSYSLSEDEGRILKKVKGAF